MGNIKTVKEMLSEISAGIENQAKDMEGVWHVTGDEYIEYVRITAARNDLGEVLPGEWDYVGWTPEHIGIVAGFAMTDGLEDTFDFIKDKVGISENAEITRVDALPDDILESIENEKQEEVILPFR